MRDFAETLTRKTTFWDFIDSFLSTFSATEQLRLTTPSNVYYRSQLLCEYISEKVGVPFDSSELIMLLYLDFLETSIQKYNPDKIYEAMTRSHGYDDTIVIHEVDRVYEFKKRQTKRTNIFLTMDKKDAKKGQLLLDEMEDLYGQAPTLEKLVSTLLINFIEDYKTGHNQKALNEIVRTLRKQFK